VQASRLHHDSADAPTRYTLQANPER
jgi:hypothetical protein